MRVLHIAGNDNGIADQAGILDHRPGAGLQNGHEVEARAVLAGPAARNAEGVDTEDLVAAIGTCAGGDGGQLRLGIEAHGRTGVAQQRRHDRRPPLAGARAGDRHAVRVLAEADRTTAVNGRMPDAVAGPRHAVDDAEEDLGGIEAQHVRSADR